MVGGWVPDLLLPAAEEPHIGSIDVDLVLDAARLGDGRYAELLQLLLDTRRYQPGPKPFQLVVVVDLQDGETPVQVDVEFLAPKQVKLGRSRGKRIAGFRVLQMEGSDMAFEAPVEHEITGRNVRGAANTVRLRVASLADFLVMKALAIGGRDKPKDSYDFCYCLEHGSEGIDRLAEIWKQRTPPRLLRKATSILHEKFAAVDAFGPQQVVEFHSSSHTEERDMQARRAYELVREFLKHLG